MRNSGLVPSFTPPDPAAVLDLPSPVIPGETDLLEKEWEKLGASSGWKHTVAFLRERQEFYRNYLPGSGMDINGLSSEEFAVAWKTAHNIIQEIDNWIDTVENIKNAATSKSSR